MKEIALALGGGGFKGISHIGVIRALEAQGYKIAAIAGTSIGGLVGAVYASGLSIDEVEDIVHSLDPKTLYAWNVSEPPSLLGLSSVSDLLLKYIGEIKFSELKIPFACTAVDLTTGQEYVLNTGLVKDAALATIAIPGIFPPQMISDITFVDGGVLDPVPVKVARWLAPGMPVVAVCLHPEPGEWATLPDQRLPTPDGITGKVFERFSRLRISQAMNSFVKSFEITNRMLSEARMKLEQPDLILRPDVGQYGILDIGPVDILLKAGIEVVEANQKAIRTLFGFQKRVERIMKPLDTPKNVLDDAHNETDATPSQHVSD